MQTRLWSSIHYFTEKTKQVLEEVTSYIENDRKERDVISTYFESILGCYSEGLTDAKIHDNDRKFFLLFKDYYPSYVPSWLIQNDFKKKGIPLNIEGSILVSPCAVSVFSRRLYAGDDHHGIMYQNIRDYSKMCKCPVLSHHIWLNEENQMKCKIYVANRKELVVIARSDSGTENYDEHCDLLPEIIPNINWEILLHLDVHEFSKQVCEALNIPEGGAMLQHQIEKNYVYTETKKLYSIFQRKSLI